MTRFFDEAGTHVPVTVLSLEGCQVVGQRTEDKDGYVALQLGAGAKKAKNTSKADARPVRQGAGRAQAHAWPNSACREDMLIDVGAELTADHFVPGQKVDVTGPHRRQGLRRRHEALELRRPARHPRRLGLPPFARLHRPAPGPGQDLQEQEDGRPPGPGNRHHPQPHRLPRRRRARPDHDQGRGARAPRARWVKIRDAIKKAPAADVPTPGAFKKAGDDDQPRRPQKRRSPKK